LIAVDFIAFLTFVYLTSSNSEMLNELAEKKSGVLYYVRVEIFVCLAVPAVNLVILSQKFNGMYPQLNTAR
jgi:hypothetical protein